jgi:prophage maintenance system killer protein
LFLFRLPKQQKKDWTAWWLVSFTDGNKRTASLTFSTICGLNNLEPNFSRKTLDEMAIYIERIKEDDHHRVIKTLTKYLFS